MNNIDYLFETSWEVCNKVGGIHTVVSTKAKTLKERIKGEMKEEEREGRVKGGREKGLVRGSRAS